MYSRLFSITIFLALCLTGTRCLGSDENLILDFSDGQDSINVAPHLSYLISKEHFTPTQASQQAFTRNNNASLHLGFVRDDLWLKLPFFVSEHQSLDNQVWYSVFTITHIRDFDVYHFVDGQLIDHIVTGTNKNFSSRRSDYSSWALELNMQAGEHILLFRIKTNAPVKTDVFLEDQHKLFERAGAKRLSYGILFGFYSLLILFSFVVFTVTRERVFLSGFGLTSVFLVAELHFSGIGFQLLWPNNPELNPLVGRAAIGLTFSMVGLFTVSFLRLHQWAPILCRSIVILSALLCLIQPLPVFAMAPKLTLLAIFLVPLLALIATTRAVLRQEPSAIFLLAAYSLFTICIALTILDVTHIISSKVYYLSFLDTGMAVMAIIIAFGLGNRLNEEKLHVKTSEERINARSAFLATMSHEIRTPMNGVIGMLNHLQKSELSNQQRHDISIAQYSAKSLLGIINDILDFSKIEAGKLDITPTEFCLISLVENTVASLNYLTDEKNVVLILNTASLITTQVSADPVRIRQMLTNLVSNALKFTHQGEVIISAEITSKSDEKVLIISVKDSGIGIAADKLNTLFESFTQADESTTRQFGGTGLGLSIVKNLSELMAGDIKVHSKLGSGSVFTMTIPIMLAQTQGTLTAPVLNQTTALVIHRNRDIAQQLARQLKAWGAKVIVDIEALQNHNKDNINLCFCEAAHPNLTSLLQSLKDNSPPISETILLKPRGQITSALAHRELNLPVLTTELSTLFEDKIRIEKPDSSQSEGLSLSQEVRLLLVEDNEINIEVALALLEDTGCTVEIAKNGREALAACEKQEGFDLILMDCQMPVMDGYEATKHIRKNLLGKAARTPIIAMTANSMKGDREKCLAAGMSDYIAKPVDPDELETKLAQWLS